MVKGLLQRRVNVNGGGTRLTVVAWDLDAIHVRVEHPGILAQNF
jgi:hypothetical protein